jgi:Caspase domain
MTQPTAAKSTTHLIILRLLLFIISAFTALLTPADAQRRLALVVGNNDYQNVPALKTAVNDARAMSKSLEKLGFTVSIVENATRRTMATRLSEFNQTIKPDDQVLFFFAGHGFEIRGTNFLLPTDVPAAQEGQDGLVKDMAIEVQQVIDRVTERGAKTTIVVLDACRDNPFEQPGTRSIRGSAGLAPLTPPEGVFVVFSAGAKQGALDRLAVNDPVQNSVFMRYFLPELETPGLTLVQIAKRTQARVKTAAATIKHDQTPAYYDQIVGDVILINGNTSSDPQSTVSVPTAALSALVQNAPSNSSIRVAPNVTFGPGVRIGNRDSVTIGGIPANQIALPPSMAEPSNHPKVVVPPGLDARKETGPQVAALTPQTVPAARVQEAPLSSARNMPVNTPLAQFMRHNGGWTVTVSLPEPAQAIQWRSTDQTAGFRDLGLSGTIDQRTGKRLPNSNFSLSNSQKSTVLEVQYVDAGGLMVGPFPIRFDPDTALFDSLRQFVDMTQTTWLSWRDFNGAKLYYTTLTSYRCAIKELRVGIDRDIPDVIIALPACDPSNPFAIPSATSPIINVSGNPRFATAQIKFADGSISEVARFDR